MKEDKYTYFLSDLHLGAPYFEGSGEAERRIVKFLDSIKDHAEALYLVGDILDYWYEYRYVVPRGFVRFFGKLAEMSDSGIKITWMIGNHDIWIFDYLPKELGIEVIDGSLRREICGKEFFISHGDGVGKRSATFKMLRGLFRSKIAQFFFSGIHPRWTVPFAYRWSRHSRMKGENKDITEETLLHGLEVFSDEYLSIHPEINYFIYGHIHVMAKKALSETCEMVVLGDWLKNFSYARICRGKELELLKININITESQH